MVANFGT